MSNIVPSSGEDVLSKSLRPAIEKLDVQVKNVQQSQRELLEVVNSVDDEVGRIGELQNVDVDFDSYLKRILNVKRRMIALDNTTKGISDRLQRLHRKLPKPVTSS